MIIAVNTRLNKESQPEGYQSLIFGLLNQLAIKYPRHQFIYLFDKPYDTTLPFTKNVLPLITGPETRNSLRLQYWFNYKIPAVLRKHKADVFVSMEGICSMRTKKPQCLLVPDLGFLQTELNTKKSNGGFLKKYTGAFIAKATTIAAVSEYSKSVLVDHYKLDAADINLINPVIDKAYQPCTIEEKEAVMEKYAEGKAYFLFSADINHRSNLINLLKAFSFFKKRQKSNMLLIIGGQTDAGFKKELSLFKYRSEVKLLENLSQNEKIKVLAAAYAFVYPVLYADFALPALEAMQCGIPVICSSAGALPSTFGEAALYADPDNFKEIAENMMLIFKDEDKARKLTEAGKALLNQYLCDKSADMLMQSILKAYDS